VAGDMTQRIVHVRAAMSSSDAGKVIGILDEELLAGDGFLDVDEEYTIVVIGDNGTPLQKDRGRLASCAALVVR
jgi:hypothetical protein